MLYNDNELNKGVFIIMFFELLRKISLFSLSFFILITTSIATSKGVNETTVAIINNDYYDKKKDYLSEIEEKSNLFDVFEVESLREETVKHFRLEDGTY